jgi:hypothetical protein
MSNLPPGTSNGDPLAPWNALDFDGADEDHGVDAVTGDDATLTAECFANFILAADNEGKPMLTKSGWLKKSVSNATLLAFVLRPHFGNHLKLAAMAEISARYIANEFTQRCISDAAYRWIAEVQS